MRTGYQKNRFCKNSHLSESMFEKLIWHYTRNNTQAHTLKDLQTHGEISKVTLRRYFLGLGDRYFDEYMKAVSASKDLTEYQKEKWPLGILAMHQAMYPFKSHFPNQKLNNVTNMFLSNEIHYAIYSSWRTYSQARRGTPLHTFTSHAGTLIKRLWLLRVNNLSFDDPKFNEKIRFLLMGEFVPNPLNIKSITKYRLHLEVDHLKVKIYKGDVLQETKCIDFQ